MLCELAGADAAAERILFRSSVRWHGLMGLIESKTAEREFRLTVEMRDDFNELPKQWKIHPFIRLNGSNTLTHLRWRTAFVCHIHIHSKCMRKRIRTGMNSKKEYIARSPHRKTDGLVCRHSHIIVLGSSHNTANLLYNILLNICTCLLRARGNVGC